MEFFHLIEITKEIEEISKEMRSCSSDAVTASKNIKHYSTLKVNSHLVN